jgi:hypothetical protein
MSGKFFGCKCGCLALFEDYEVGYEIYIGNEYCLSDYKMFGYDWSDYIKMNEYKTWGELKADIIFNYNSDYQYDDPSDFVPWIHLYNKYCIGDSCIVNVDGNEKLYYEFVI